MIAGCLDRASCLDGNYSTEIEDWFFYIFEVKTLVKVANQMLIHLLCFDIVKISDV